MILSLLNCVLLLNLLLLQCCSSSQPGSTVQHSAAQTEWKLGCMNVKNNWAHWVSEVYKLQSCLSLVNSCVQNLQLAVCSLLATADLSTYRLKSQMLLVTGCVLINHYFVSNLVKVASVAFVVHFNHSLRQACVEIVVVLDMSRTEVWCQGDCICNFTVHCLLLLLLCTFYLLNNDSILFSTVSLIHSNVLLPLGQRNASFLAAAENHTAKLDLSSVSEWKILYMLNKCCVVKFSSGVPLTYNINYQ